LVPWAGRNMSLVSNEEGKVETSAATATLADKASSLVRKRMRNVTYYKRLHAGSVLWLNAVRLTQQNICNFYDPDDLRVRAKQFFSLGMSLGKILLIENPGQVLVALNLLMLEYEYMFYTNGPAQVVKLLYAEESSCVPRSLVHYVESQPFPVTLKKFQNDIVFEFLFCPHENANQLDYFVVFDTLCDTLALIYEKLNLLDVKYDHVYNDLITFDNKIKHHIFSKISKEMHALSEEVVSVQLKTMDNLFESQDGLRAMFQDNW